MSRFVRRYGGLTLLIAAYAHAEAPACSAAKLAEIRAAPTAAQPVVDIDCSATLPPNQVLVRMSLTLVRDIDRRVVGSRTFETAVNLQSNDAMPVAAAFNAAMAGLLRQATVWTVSAMGGRVS